MVCTSLIPKYNILTVFQNLRLVEADMVPQVENSTPALQQVAVNIGALKVL